MVFKFILLHKVIEDFWLVKAVLEVFRYTIRQNNADYFIKYAIHRSTILINMYSLMKFIILPRFHSLKLISGHGYAGKVTLEQIVLNTSKRNCSARKWHILSEITVPK
jgi:hypothetical protein